MVQERFACRPAMRTRCAGLLAAALLSLSATAGQTALPQEPAVISGVVVDSATGRSIAEALVNIRVDGRQPDNQRGQLTDARGRFVFTDVPANGLVSVHATAFGYLGSSGDFDDSTSRTRFPVQPGEWISDLRVALDRPGVLAGRVVDETGDPVIGAPVTAIERFTIGGRPAHARALTALTDDRGIYRIAELAPGSYVVQVPGTPAAAEGSGPRPGPRIAFPTPPPSQDGQRFSYPTIYYPGVRGASLATLVELDAGETREGIDVRLTPVFAARLEGTVAGPLPEVNGLPLRLEPVDGTDTEGDVLTTLADASGAFAFDRVAAGDYVLRGGRRASQFVRSSRLNDPRLGGLIPPGGGQTSAVETGPDGIHFQQASSNSASQFFVEMPVSVSGTDDLVLAVTARAGATLRGRVRKDVDSRHEVPTLEPVAGILLDPVDGRWSAGLPDSDVRADDPTDILEITSIEPGQYSVRASYGWLVKRVTWNGADFTHRPLDTERQTSLDGIEVTVTNATSSVSGRVTTSVNQPTSGFVILFPATADRWDTIGLRSPDTRKVAILSDGRYGISGLPAGDYLIAAVANPNVALDPPTLSRLGTAATRLTLDWGVSRSLDLRMEVP